MEDSLMATFVFAALTVIAAVVVAWGTAAVALRRSQQEQLTMAETEETGAAPGWYITPAHLRMW
jgi:hypothetical protein